MNILVTGAAGFIGHALCKRLITDGHTVTGIDNLNNYYDVGLKLARLSDLGIDRETLIKEVDSRNTANGNFVFHRMDLTDREELPRLFTRRKFSTVVNLAAQAGVRYSIDNPFAYIHSNIEGFLNVLECCRRQGGETHLVYASSSSVYGDSADTPFEESHATDRPVSLYAATKKADEMMARLYTDLYGFRATGLRFFTVYGPWGRPDMAPFLFLKALFENQPIRLFNHGNLSRDFTYIDDIVEGLVRIVTFAEENSREPSPLHRIYNIGHGSPVKLNDFIQALQQASGRKARMEFVDMQPGDVHTTFADTRRLQTDFGYRPATPLNKGIESFCRWYKAYYKL